SVALRSRLPPLRRDDADRAHSQHAGRERRLLGPPVRFVQDARVRKRYARRMTISQHATVNPVFRYRDCSAAIAWLIRVYGFEQHEVHQAPDGTVVHAEAPLRAARTGMSA